MQESTELADLSLNESPAKFKLSPRWFTVIFVAVTLIVGAAAVTPFYFSRQEKGPSGPQNLKLIATHDMGAHFAFMEQFDKVLRSGVYYPRWLPDINDGYGIATMNFYPPGFYYLTSLVHVAFKDWGETLFVISVLSLSGSGLAFYFLSRQFYDRLPCAIGAIFYMLLPYHTLDLYWRGAMPEFLGFVFLPIIVYFAFKLGAQGQPHYYAGLGFFYGLHLITHFPVSYLFTYALALYALLWATRNKDWRIVFRIAGGMALGLILSAIYWLPAALESKHTQEAISEIFPYHLSLITLTPGRNPFDVLINHTFTIQTAAIIIAFLTLRATVLNPLSRPDSSKFNHPELQSRLSVIMAFTTTFLCTMFAIQIVTRIPKIQATVPAWRWLAIASVFTSLLISASIHYLGKEFGLPGLKLWAYRIAVGIVVALNLWISVQYSIVGALSNATHISPTKFIEGGFTPKGSTMPDKLPDSALVELHPEGGEIEVIRWEPQNREIMVNLNQPCVARLKTYYFPGWMARIDGQPATLSSDSDGVQLIEVPQGIHKVEVTFVNTAPRTFGTVLSGLGFLIIVCLTFVARGRGHKREAKAHSITTRHKSETESETSSLEEGENQGKAKWRWTDKRTRQIVISSLLLLVVIFAVIMIFRTFIKEDRSAVSKDASTQSGARSIGTDARLQIQGLDSILVAGDDNALHELMNALPKRDESELEKLVQLGKVFRVPNGTKVRILEFGSSKTKIRIIEGEHIMREGWVPDRWVAY